MKNFEKLTKMVPKTYNTIKFPHIVTLILLALVVAALHLTRNKQNQVVLKEEQIGHKNVANQGCNLFSGRWEYDNVSYPLYKEKECAFIQAGFACETYGRKNLEYQHWRWQPHQCDLPRFNGTALLEKLRGKNLIFIGDSLNRNQWESMLCLIEPYLPPSSRKTLKMTGNMTIFHSIEYNATIGFYWEPLLVETNCDDVTVRHVRPRIIRLKSIENHARHWNDADILVFDSYAWWMDPTMAVLWGSSNSYKTIETKRSYEITLNTWSDWLELHINRTKTKLFFMSASPYTLGRTVWGTGDGCYNKTEPILNESYLGNGANRDMMQIVESTIQKLEQRGLKVEYLNITQLSGYREDARPSIYRPFWEASNRDEFKDYTKYAECLHWCLPGVPDVWNQILYAYIMKS